MTVLSPPAARPGPAGHRADLRLPPFPLPIGCPRPAVPPSCPQFPAGLPPVPVPAALQFPSHSVGRFTLSHWTAKLTTTTADAHVTDRGIKITKGCGVPKAY